MLHSWLSSSASSYSEFKPHVTLIFSAHLEPNCCSHGAVQRSPVSPSSQRQCFLLEPFLSILLQCDDKKMNWRLKLLPMARVWSGIPCAAGIQRIQTFTLSVLLGQLSLLVYDHNIPPVFKASLKVKRCH